MMGALLLYYIHITQPLINNDDPLKIRQGN